MPYKYKHTRRPYHSGEYFYRPKRSMGLKYATLQKKRIRARALRNYREALRLLRNKYFRYTPKGGYKGGGYVRNR